MQQVIYFLRRWAVPRVVAIALLAAISAVIVVNGVGCQSRRPSGSTPSSDGRDVGFDVNSAGTQIVFVGAGNGQRDLYLLDLSKRTVERLTDTSAYEQHPIFTPDGRSIIYSASEPSTNYAIWNLYLLDVKTKVSRPLTRGRVVDIPSAVSPDGKLLLYTRLQNAAQSQRREVYVLELQKENVAPRKLPLTLCDGSLSKRGTVVVSASSVEAPSQSLLIEFSVYDWLKGEQQSALQTRDWLRPVEQQVGEEIYSPSWVDNDQKLAFIAAGQGSGYEVWLLDIAKSQLQQLTRNRGYIEQLRVARDGGGLFFLKMEGNGRLMRKGIWQLSDDRTKLEQVADYTIFEQPLSWSGRSR